MNVSSFTQAFYNLIDLSETEQKKELDRIKSDNPQLHERLCASLQTNNHLDLSHLIGFQADQIISQDNLFNLSGQLIDKYRLLHELGRGGMGVVYEAERADKTFKQKLAIKFIQPSLSKIVSTDFLYLEAQLLANLNHPYIAKVFDGGKHEELIYIAMEKVEGQTLREFMEENSLSTPENLELFIKICSAIEHAHQNRILHADIKPENVIIDGNGNPKVLDFNITQKLKSSQQQLDASLLAYSVNFASPEQKEGAYLTNQSDVFSLGKLLDFMLPEINIHSDLLMVINKATETEASQRYGSVELMAQDIKNILTNHPISLKSHQLRYITKKLIQRRPFHAIAIVSAIISSVIFSTVLINKNHQLHAEKEIAEEMMFELTQLLFHAKGNVDKEKSVQNMLELTRRRVLSNPELPRDLKQKMLLAMMTPIPERVTNLENNKNEK